jgi:ABC-type sugar transport system substrate-binding protein
MRAAKRSAALCAMVVALGVLAAGCGGSSSTGSNNSASTSSTSSTSSASASKTASATSSAGKKYSIGLVPFAGTEPTSMEAIHGIEAVAKQRGWRTTFIDPNGVTSQSVAAIQTLVEKHVNLIVSTVFPATALAAGVLDAKRANIPVIAAGGSTGPGVEANWDVGDADGKLLVKELAKTTHGTGNLLVYTYTPGVACDERVASLKAYAKTAHFSSITYDEVPIPGQVQAGYKFAQAWLADHSGTGAIFGCFDDPTVGALAAIKQAGRTNITTLGVDGSAAALNAVKAGTMTATVWINGFGLGEEMAAAIPDLIGKGVNAAPIVKPAPAVLVTKANFKAFLKKYPNAYGGT